MTDTPRLFDPAQHLSLINGNEYLEVKFRLVWLRSDEPDAQINTELLTHTNNVATFKATVTLPGDRGSATGHGMESAQNFGDYLEKAETKAIGRALAALGFGTQFCQDHDFGAAQGRVVDAPVQQQPTPMRQPQQQAPRQQYNQQPQRQGFQQRSNQQQGQQRGMQNPDAPATDAQRGFIAGLFPKGMGDDQRHQLVSEYIGADYDTITKGQAHDVIDALKGGTFPLPNF